MAKFVADLHLHSAYARATSKNLNFDSLTEWAKIKGIDLLSSADFTHPLWFEETKKKLKEDGTGLLSYNGSKFMLGAEVSCIFSQGGRLRRVHLLLYVPTIEAAEKVNAELGKRGKLASDGRPILGLTARNVLEILLEASPEAIMIPAHAWTPWFGVLGQNGGFNSLEEAFGDLTPYIYAIETGLSSDPEMNWRIKELDRVSLVSFSDAHSAPKMGRELTILETDLSYAGLLNALKRPQKVGQRFNSDPNPRDTSLIKRRNDSSLVLVDPRKSSQPSPQKILSTIEFFPEEGKYHINGHRNCNFKENPEDTLKRGLLCPVCKRPLTIGVMHRVEHLAEKDRPLGYSDQSRPSFQKLVPLQEIVAEAIGSPVTSSRVVETYQNLTKKLGSEVGILTEAETDQIARHSSERISEGIGKVRKGDIVIEPGFDGVFGVVRIWPENSVKTPPKPIKKKEMVKTLLRDPESQISLFDPK